MKEVKFKNYLKSAKLSDKTIVNYMYQLKRFEEINNVNIETLIKNKVILYGQKRDNSYCYIVSKNGREHGDLSCAIKKYEKMVKSEINVDMENEKILLSQYGKIQGFLSNAELWLNLSDTNRTFGIRMSANTIREFKNIEIIETKVNNKTIRLISSNCLEAIKKHMATSNVKIVLLDLLKSEINFLKVKNTCLQTKQNIV